MDMTRQWHFIAWKEPHSCLACRVVFAPKAVLTFRTLLRSRSRVGRIASQRASKPSEDYYVPCRYMAASCMVCWIQMHAQYLSRDVCVNRSPLAQCGGNGQATILRAASGKRFPIHTRKQLWLTRSCRYPGVSHDPTTSIKPPCMVCRALKVSSRPALEHARGVSTPYSQPHLCKAANTIVNLSQ
jgi:hypothetical protein